jgi:uncharacterized membrane protein (Fun14 family)
MKCIRCQLDSKYPERKDRTCPKCYGKFAFEPREGDLLTDTAFQRAIQAVSASGGLRWGVEHLYYEICRRQRVSPWKFFGYGLGAGFFVGFAVRMIIQSPLASVLVGLVVGLLTALFFYLANSAPFVRIDGTTFRKMYERWQSTHGTPEGVIVRQDQPAPRKQVEPDLGDYSFDRAVICDRARTVDLLLANNFHFENNCAVLAVEGYPRGPFETVRTMLKKNPHLQVYALHDATPDGCRLAHRLATDPNWFADGVKVIDVGLRPAHGKRMQGLLLESRATGVQEGEGLTHWEAVWLGKYALELAAIRPEQVLKRLFRTINQTINTEDYDDGVIYLAPRDPAQRHGGGDGGTMGADLSKDAGDTDGPADSFG